MSHASADASGQPWYLRARLKLRHLELLVALDEQRNLHHTASVLGISQPAISRLLGELEQRLDVRLFERHPRGVTPTWHGESLIRHARSLLTTLVQAGDELEALSQGLAGSVTIGSVQAPAMTLLSDAVAEVSRESPLLKISVTVDVSRDLVPKLRDGEFDFVIARIPGDMDASDFVVEEIGEEALRFVCRAGHPLAAAPELSAMRDYPWVMQPLGSLMRQRVEQLFLHHGLAPPSQVIDTPDIDMALSLVDRSDTLTVTTREVADLLCATPRFRVLPSPNVLSVQPYGLISLRERRLSPAAARLMRTLHRLIQQRRQAEKA